MGYPHSYTTSDTPRTDAALVNPELLTLVNLARQLERELNAATQVSQPPLVERSHAGASTTADREPAEAASATPRTAAIARKWSLNGGCKNGSDASPEAKELYEHASQLERELAESRANADDWMQRYGATQGHGKQSSGPDDSRLRAVLEGLECQQIDKLMHMPPDVLRAVAVEIGHAAKLGACLYVAKPCDATPNEGSHG